MSPDFRSDKSETLEGKGLALRAWETYADQVNRMAMPLIKPAMGKATKAYMASQVADLVGFWLMWHLHGGFEGLEELGMHRSTIFRKVKRFRTLFTVHPDEYQIPGVKIDPKKYIATVQKRQGR